MTNLPAAQQWMLSRQTRLESGREQIDFVDIEGIPVRVCTGLVPGMHPLTPDTANIDDEDQK